MNNFLLHLLDWIYKKKCYFCSNSAESVKMCSNCYADMECSSVSKNRIIEGVDIFCAGVYADNLQKLIRGLKYHNQRDLAHYQAKFMFEYWKKILKTDDSIEVVPVPLYKSREKARKYNHMALVAEEFCKLSGYKLNLEVLTRIKDTKPQYRLNRGERMENLSEAFCVDLGKLSCEKIMIIDDICTTGSTFESIISEFKKYSFDNIVCFATATPFDDNL